jgi:quinoprotein glucose dehydrogenase
MKLRALGAGLAVGVMALAGCRQAGPPIDHSGPVDGWGHWGGTQQGTRYSPLTQITPENVGRLKVAWTYRIGMLENLEEMQFPALQVTPILAEGRLYACSSVNRVVALDPEAGTEIWSYDPQVSLAGVYVQNCRGVTYHRDDTAPEGAECRGRILMGTLDARLIALDAATGRPCSGFGDGGTVDLRAGLGKTVPGSYHVSSPPVIADGKAILGGYVWDNVTVDSPAGVVRAFDVQTGELAWAWNSVPPGRSDDEMAGTGEPYIRGTANAWTVFSVDAERGLVFVPTGNTSPDLYGAMRDGIDYYGSSLVALEAATGRLVWHFKTVNHDLWDFDVPAQPVLFDFPTAGGAVPAVAQATKQGDIFILDRRDGTPLVPVEQRPAPQGGAVQGETPAATQPAVVNAAYSVYPGDLSEEDMWGFTPWDRRRCRELFRKHRYDGKYTLPSLEGSVTFPFSNGLLNWGSVSIDPVRQILVTNSTRIAAVVTAIPRDEADARMAQGERMYPTFGAPYAFKHEWLVSPLGAPCNPPPWGVLLAIDLKQGKRLWEVPIGTTRELAPWPLWMRLGVPNIGGSVVTASGLTFIGATTDSYFRAYETQTGKLLWEDHMPAGGQANPMTFRLRPDGKQYVVIAAGGHRYLQAKLGDYLIAYALPD